VPVRGTGKADILMALEAFFITQTTQGKRCLLIVDEAQNLRQHAVEELRMLSNFQFGDQALLQTFLVGQPEFREILQGPGMLQLRQRVTARCHLGPLDEEDTRAYIEHRLKCAGATDRPTFDTEVFRVIHQFCGGIPRRINTLCDRLLLQGYLAESSHFTADDVNEVIVEMQAENAVPDAGASPASDPWANLPGQPVSRPAPLMDFGDSGMGAMDPLLVDDMARQLTQMSAMQLSDRLLRIERSMLRQERLGLELLEVLRRLSVAGRLRAGSDAPPSDR
jgi:general secretion pathway protein A